LTSSGRSWSATGSTPTSRCVFPSDVCALPRQPQAGILTPPAALGQFGNTSGTSTLLVLTGVNQVADIDPSGTTPTFVVDSLGAFRVLAGEQSTA
jgi:hypothetical protein